MNFERLMGLLRERFESTRERNPSYTLRSFARDAGLSSGAVSEIFAGKRRMTLKRALVVAERLSFDPQERIEIFGFQGSRAINAEISLKYLQLNADIFSSIAESVHFTLLSLIRIEDVDLDLDLLQRRLSLPKTKIKEALDRLERLDFIERTDEGGYRRLQPPVRSSDDVSSSAVRRAHHQSLDHAKEVLGQMPVDERDFSFVSFPMNPSQLPQLKTRIREIQDQLLAEFESTEKNSEVFRFQTQCFPMTRPTKDS